jgi:hypothetical protein
MKMRVYWILVSILVLNLLAGCGGTEPAQLVIPTDTFESIQSVDTPAPTETAAEAPGVVILISPTEPDPVLSGAVSELALARGLVYEQRVEINPQLVPENLVMVVSEGEFVGLAEMVDLFPEVKFVIDGEFGGGQRPNLYVLGVSGDLNLHQAFVAGYIAAVQSDEYRIGIISVNDAAGQDYRDSFMNGVIYFCGTCVPIYPPFEVYPLFVEVTPGADRTSLESAAQTLIGKGVNMMLVAPQIQDADFYQYLAQVGIRIVGTDAPPAGNEGNWVASVLIYSGTPLEDILSALLDDLPVPTSSETISVDYTGVGEARLAHFYEILEKLNSGMIDPLGKVD